MRRFRSEAISSLGEWEHRFAPALRDIAPSLRSGDQEKLRSAMDRISAAIAGGFRSPDTEAPFRVAIRDLMSAMRMPLPSLTPAESAICELHGTACPLLEKAAT